MTERSEEERLARASDDVLDAVADLQELETARRAEPVSASRFGELSKEIETKATEVARAARKETGLALRAEGTDRTIEETATGEGDSPDR